MNLFFCIPNQHGVSKGRSRYVETQFLVTSLEELDNPGRLALLVLTNTLMKISGCSLSCPDGERVTLLDKVTVDIVSRILKLWGYQHDSLAM